MSLPSFKAFRPGDASLEDIRKAQMYVDYVLITEVPVKFFPFSGYQKGVYYVTVDSIFEVKNPAFLFANKLVKSRGEDFTV